MDGYDYIIVGAGSAGCVIANRLSADSRNGVLLLEAGGSDRYARIKAPIGYGLTFHDPKMNWRLHAARDPSLDHREMYWPRGKVLGGSSSINALVWCRGLDGDFDDWRAAGNPGWSAAETTAVFERIERRVDADGVKTGVGLQWVSDRSRDLHGLGQSYMEAATEIGLEKGNTISGEGVGPYWSTTRDGRRHSAADAFLKQARKRRNLRVITGAEVTRLDFEGRCARGVSYLHRGQALHAECRGEVILCAGAVKSPQLLQLSGIGPAEQLRTLGIKVRLDAPCVGGGLQDHLGMSYAYRASEPTLNQVLGTKRGQLASALQYLLKRNGAFSLGVNQMGGLVRSRAELDRADIQLYFTPLSYSTTYRNRRPLLRPDPWPGFVLGFNPCRPTSRGRIDIASADPMTPPTISPNALSTNTDVSAMIAGARLIERLLATSAMRRVVVAENGFSPVGKSDDEILADIRARAGTVFHPCGTCRMAPREAGGVVDPKLRVWGIERLRVIDASIFPNITSANTNAPTIMTAMRAADFILEE